MSASCLYDVRHACVRLTIASEESAKCLPCAAVPFTGILHIRTEPHNLEHETRYLHSIHRTHRGQIFLVVELVTRYAGRRVRYDGLLETRSPKGFRAMALAGCYNGHLLATCYNTMAPASPTALERCTSRRYPTCQAWTSLPMITRTHFDASLSRLQAPGGCSKLLCCCLDTLRDMSLVRVVQGRCAFQVQWSRPFEKRWM